jgi:hypothetical protein
LSCRKSTRHKVEIEEYNRFEGYSVSTEVLFPVVRHRAFVADVRLVAAGEYPEQHRAIRTRLCHFLPLTYKTSETSSVTVAVTLVGMMHLRWNCACALFLSLTVMFASGFNLNWEDALLFHDPQGQIGSYFGFTVALRHQGSTHW